MRRSLVLYRAVEAVIGRPRTARLGRWLYLGSRRELANDPEVNGEYALQDWILDGIAGGDHPLSILDVGANLGDWTSSLLDKLRPDQACVVHAFEPAPSQHGLLCKRLRAGIEAGKVLVMQRGVAAAPGNAAFAVTGDASGNSSLALGSEPSNVVIEIELTTLDREFPTGSALDLIKVDTEGNDFNVILGARRLFDNAAIGVLQFEYNWRWIDFGYALKSVFDFVHDRPYVLGKLTQDGIEIYERWHFELDRYIETNYVIVRKDLISQLPHRRMVMDSSNLPRPAAA